MVLNPQSLIHSQTIGGVVVSPKLKKSNINTKKSCMPKRKTEKRKNKMQ
jgi:hypothetical protein